MKGLIALILIIIALITMMFSTDPLCLIPGLFIATAIILTTVDQMLSK